MAQDGLPPATTTSGPDRNTPYECLVVADYSAGPARLHFFRLCSDGRSKALEALSRTDCGLIFMSWVSDAEMELAQAKDGCVPNTQVSTELLGRLIAGLAVDIRFGQRHEPGPREQLVQAALARQFPRL